MKRIWPVVVCLGLAPLPLGATSYLPVADREMALQASLIGIFEVTAVDPAPTGSIATDYTVGLERLIKGESAAGTLLVRIPGGIDAAGRGLKVFGVPVFTAGDRVLLFLRPRSDGAWSVLHLILGAFHIRDVEGRLVAVRPYLGEARALAAADRGVEPDGLEARGVERFASWLSALVSGSERPPDYWQSLPPGTLTERFRVIRDDVTGLPLRWFEFDAGARVSWRAHQDGQDGFTGGGFDEVRWALQSWSGVSGTNVDLVYRGKTSSDGGFETDDGLNTVLFNDPNDEISEPFSCLDGGVLAIGGTKFERNLRGTFKGATYLRIQEAEVVTNAEIGCFLFNLSGRIEELIGHEIGHTLGLGHSCGDSQSPPCSSSALLDDALMRATIHGDQRGTRLNSDDQAGLRSLYGAGGGGGGALAAPGDLAAAFEEGAVDLTWDDLSSGENGFRIYRRRDQLGELSARQGSFDPIAETAAGAEAFTDDTLSQAGTYTYEVRAFNDSGEGEGSNQAIVIVDPTGRPELAAPVIWTEEGAGSVDVSLKRVGGSSGEISVVLTTRALSAAAGADYGSTTTTLQWGDGDDLPKTVTVSLIDDVVVERTELVEVVLVSATGLLGGAQLSPGVLAIIDNDGPPGCGESTEHLCLLLGRFKVEAEWRNQRNGKHGLGTSLPGTDQSGYFWFFNPENVELIVKVLDARFPPFDAFWLFYGGLSDVEYWITVTDTVSGERRLYRNVPYDICGLGDTEAFPSPAPASRLRILGDPGLPLLAPPHSAALRQRGAALGPRADCIADELSLCLLGGRFKVDVEWHDHRSGNDGVGTAIPFSDQSGFFWFFDSQNIELVVKVLNGVPLNGDFWVFYGALSDVEYTLRVTDTVTGAVKEYVNEAGSICGNGDTHAFEGGP